MKIIEKKIWPEMFENDKKMPTDFRLADFYLEDGDKIKFREWDPETKKYTGREFIKTVKRVSKHNSPTKYWTKEELEKSGLYIIEWEDN
jgi:hypothetical protein